MWAGVDRESAGHPGCSQQLLGPCGWLVPCAGSWGRLGCKWGPSLGTTCFIDCRWELARLEREAAERGAESWCGG